MNGIRIIKKTKPGECGGTDASVDERAPKVITSGEMTLFDVTSALSPSWTMNGETLERLGFVSAFAAPAGGGTFLFLQTGKGPRYRAEKIRSWAWIKEDVFPSLVELVNECDLAKNNGYHSQTHGLPENFGGWVRIRYASGECIDFSDNQAPIIRNETGQKIADLFLAALEKERMPLPDISLLRSVSFEENRKDGGFTRAKLTLTGDGSAINEKAACYGGPTVYESTKEVDRETVDAIKKNIEETGLLAWSALPASAYSSIEKKTLVFAFESGEQITVPNGRELPDPIRNGFFNVELEMTTKH